MTDTLIAEKNGDKKIQKEVASILRPVALAGLIGIMVTAGGCAPLSVDYDSRVYLPENYTFYTDGGTSELQIAEWWRNFNDPVLDKLIAEALVSNRDLIAATERYNSAMHEAGLAEADKGPAAGAGAGAAFGAGAAARGAAATAPPFSSTSTSYAVPLTVMV